MSEPVQLTIGEALDAVDRCAFEIEGGRRVVHCFQGTIGADWDVEAVARTVADSMSRGWFDSMFGRCLCVLTAGARTLVFDTVTPA